MTDEERRDYQLDRNEAMKLASSEVRNTEDGPLLQATWRLAVDKWIWILGSRRTQEEYEKRIAEALARGRSEGEAAERGRVLAEVEDLEHDPSYGATPVMGDKCISVTELRRRIEGEKT